MVERYNEAKSERIQKLPALVHRLTKHEATEMKNSRSENINTKTRNARKCVWFDLKHRRFCEVSVCTFVKNKETKK